MNTTTTQTTLVPTRVDDLEVLEIGHSLDMSSAGVAGLELLWVHNREWEAGQVCEQYRVLAPLLLRYLPQESRGDATHLDRMRTVLTGLYNQRRVEFDVVQILAGIWQPQPLGVVQIYATLTWHADLAEAQRRARLAQAALHSALSATFEQIVLESLPTSQTDWLLKAYQRMLYTTVVIGQPDERMAAKGMGREGPGEKMQTNAETGVTGQQLELFLRGMAVRQEEFVATLIASRVSTTALSGWLMGLADEASVVASLQTGSESVSASIALPLTLSANLGQSVSSAFGQNRGIAYGQSRSLSQSRAHTVGYATSTGRTITDGTAHSVGFSSSSGSSTSAGVSISTGTARSTGTAESTGTAHTTGTAHSTGTAHTSGSFSSSGTSAGYSGGVSTTTGTSSGQSHGGGTNEGVSSGTSYGGGSSIGMSTGESASVSSGTNASTSTGSSTGESFGVNAGVNAGGNAQIGIPGTLGAGGSVGGSVGASQSWSTGESTGQSAGSSTGTTMGTSTGQNVGSSTNWGASQGASSGSSSNWGASQGASAATTASSGWSYGSTASSGSSQATTNSSGVTNSASDTTSQGTTTSQGNTTSQGVTYSRGTGSFSSSTNSVSDTVSHSESISTSTTRSTSDSTGTAESTGASTTQSEGLSLGRSTGFAQGFGMGFGGVTSFGIGRNYQWFNDQAIQLTNLLRAQEEQLRRATLEGAWLTDFYVLTATEEGAVAVETTVRQAFQGSGPQIITPVQTRTLSREEQHYLQIHSAAFTPSTRLEPRKATYEPYRDATTLLPIQLAAYMAPALFEEGLATTTQERIPAFAFYPDMPGTMAWARQISTETGRVTDTLLRLAPERFFHTVFASDTGFGKSVAAERLCVESTRALKSRTIILGFAPGWTKLHFAPGLQDRVITYQLKPGAIVPFRWNPWQVGQRIQPEQQLFATCEIFMNAGRMGERQYGYMVRAGERMWTEAGVLVNSEPVLNHSHWGRVLRDEWDILEPVWNLHSLNRVRGALFLRDLTPWERQALAVYRSRHTGFPQWLALLREMLEGKTVTTEEDIVDKKTGAVTGKKKVTKQVGGMKPGAADYTSLEGLLLRLQVFGIGDLARMYAPGADTVAVENLGLLGPAGDQWGIAILEGGASMPAYPKAAIFGLVAWHLYNDAMARREDLINQWGGDQVLQIYFEEANKILSGVDTGINEGRSGATTTEQFQTMWRDGRRYRTYLHLMVQSPSELPPGILSSCNNAWVGQLKSPPDRDVMMSLLAWSEKGFVDEDYKRFISRMPQTYGIIKLGYTSNPAHTAPVLTQALMLATREATDAEIYTAYERLGGH